MELENNFDRLLKINEHVCIIADTHNPDSCSAYEAKAKETSDQGEWLTVDERILGELVPNDMSF